MSIANALFTPFTQEYLDDVLRVEQAAYSHPWTRGNFQDSMLSGYHMLALHLGGELIGYYVAMRGVDEMHLLNVTVAPSHQGQGRGKHMLDMVCHYTRERLVSCLWLEVRRSNLRAISIYQKYGFLSVGDRKNYYPVSATQREDAIVMRIQL
ncbi:MAG: ribosomal-protein-alanine N-acetyltransferase [Limnohabitans sp.]|nr:ribosomal-protein-alanine N-acetyltransferase [Limnohabitans sp.]